MLTKRRQLNIMVHWIKNLLIYFQIFQSGHHPVYELKSWDPSYHLQQKGWGQACAPLWHGVLFFAVSLADPVELLMPVQSWFNHINSVGQWTEVWHKRQKCTKNTLSEKHVIFCTKNWNLLWVLNCSKEFHVEATVLYRVLKLILKIPVGRVFFLY